MPHSDFRDTDFRSETRQNVRSFLFFYFLIALVLCSVQLLGITPEKYQFVVLAFWSLFTSQPSNKLIFLSSGLKWVIKEPSLLGLNKFQRLLIHASDSNVNGGLEVHSNQNSSVPVTGHNDVEPFRGKPGSVSFYGLTYQSVEEGKLESSPFEEEGSSYFWLLAPTGFVASLILPQFFIGNLVGAFFKDVILVGIYRTLYFLLTVFEFRPFCLVLE